MFINKSLGPDGLYFEFIKRNWTTMKPNIMDCVNEFHINVKFPKVITSSFLALILKNKNAKSLNEYKPIYLVGFLYKIISKILTTRPKRVIGTIISKN